MTEVATLLGITESDARQFCVEVQRASGGPVPSFRLIADCLEQHPDARDSPAEIARIIKLARPHIVSPRPPKHAARLKRRKGKRRRRSGQPGESTLPTVALAMAHDPREFTKDLPKCPHGVLKTKKCAICDPEGFRLEYGQD